MDERLGPPDDQTVEGLSRWARQMAAELQRLQDELQKARSIQSEGARDTPAGGSGIEAFEKRLGRAVVEAQQRAQGTIADAEREAAELRAQARAEAESLLAQARRDATALLRAARDSVAQLHAVSGEQPRWPLAELGEGQAGLGEATG